METKSNISVLEDEINWLKEVIHQVITSYFLQDGHEKNWRDIEAPDLSLLDNSYAKIVREWGLGVYERLAIALAMAPAIHPEILDVFFGKNQMYDRGFTEFGGMMDKDHSGFLPTGQTLNFIITSLDPELKIELLNILGNNSLLVKERLLLLSETETHIPYLNGVLSISNHWMHYFITGEQLVIEHSASFPAQKISTSLDWKDIVLDDTLYEQIMEINAWLTHGQTIMDDWNLKKVLKPGYRSLFHGPPGTGKTLTATLLGKSTNRDVYKVDLSMIISKYIGETEKNLAKIFDIAQHKDWILFFDEADALFGKRTEAHSSNDLHANQQIAYLLQRIEDFSGTVILASNLRANMDEAFTRRFQSMVHFGMPKPPERYQIWNNAFSGTCTLDPDIDLWQIAEDYELTGGAIINVLRYCALSAVKREDTVVTKQELLTGIKKEYKKENKTLKTY